MIRYPPQVTVKDSLKVTVDASQYEVAAEKQGIILKEPLIDLSARQIMFHTDTFKTQIVASPLSSKELIITIEGFTNPLTNEMSSSFEIVTFNQKDKVLYLIDEINKGLGIENKCNFPCETCLSTNPNYC